MALNKGEWSELYTIFYLLSHNRLKIVDRNLKIISDDIFEIKSILAEKKQGLIEFKIENGSIKPIVFNKEKELISAYEIDKFRKEILNSILSSQTNGKGAFNMIEVDDWLKDKGIYQKFKGPSKNKNDISTINLDLIRNETHKLGYSIKSQLGRPSTILMLVKLQILNIELKVLVMKIEKGSTT